MIEKVAYTMPFAKIDMERRIISGFATLNNVDSQGDIVTSDASVKAFKSFRGNVREQHSKIAAGKMLSFGVEQYFDKIANKIYDGIFVRAYISKGAPDTWEKILDGTLNGFSVGGKVNEWENVIDDNGNVVKVIKGYDLEELSVVDNPANKFATITSIQKSSDFDFFAEQAGHMEKEIEMSEEVAEVVVEPVVDVTPEIVDTVIVEEPPKSEPVEETSDKSAEIEGSEAGSSAESVLDGVISEVKSLLGDNATKTSEAFAEIVSQLKELQASVATQVDEVKGELAAVKSTVSEFNKRVESVENDTAVRKSADIGGVPIVQEPLQKSVWGGRFLTSDL
jgi:hypothetical protein